jgi:hypothetical protein
MTCSPSRASDNQRFKRRKLISTGWSRRHWRTLRQPGASCQRARWVKRSARRYWKRSAKCTPRGSVATLQSPRGRLAECSSWHLWVCGLFKCRQFEPEVILLAVGWYLRFSLSYRDLEELLAERGVHSDHVTVWRWVQRYAPELQQRLRPHLKPADDSWRMDETYVRVKGKWRYLCRAVDSTGPSSTSFSQPSRTRPRLSVFSQKLWAERAIRHRG